MKPIIFKRDLTEKVSCTETKVSPVETFRYSRSPEISERYFAKVYYFFLFSHLFLTKAHVVLYINKTTIIKRKTMSIDYNTIMTSSSEEVEDYINKNDFTDKQKLEIYSFYNRNRKDKITVNIKKERNSDIQP